MTIYNGKQIRYTLKSIIAVCSLTLIILSTFTLPVSAKNAKKPKKQTVYVVTEKQSEEVCDFTSYDNTYISTYKYNKNGLLKSADVKYMSYTLYGMPFRYKYSYKGKEVVTANLTHLGSSYNKKLKIWYYDKNGVPKEWMVKTETSKEKATLKFNKRGELKFQQKTVNNTFGSKFTVKDSYSYDKNGNIKKHINNFGTIESHEYTCDEHGNIISERESYNGEYSGNCTHTLTYNEQGLLDSRYTVDSGNTYGDAGEGDPVDPRLVIDVKQNYTYKALRVDKEYVDMIKKQQWEILNDLGILYLQY